MRHPLDPPAAHGAAVLFGRLRAAGLLEEAEARVPLAEAVRRAAGVDRGGLAARLAHAFADARDDCARRRRAARGRIRARLKPLLEAGAAREAILAAAAEAADASLLPGEARALAAALVAERLRRLR
jgi:hypothetical protein